MPITRQMSALIERKASEEALRAQARDDGMETMFERAAQLVSNGTSVAEEVLRVVDVDTERAHCPACEKVIEETFAVCPHCATPLRSTCSSCGMQLQKEWQLCPYCGSGIKPPMPIAPTVDPIVPATLLPSAPPTVAMPTRAYRALVVDDQPDMRRLAARTLQSSDLPITVIEAADGVEALARVEEELPELVLLDIMMPGMDGFAVCERLRANVRTAFIPILMLTARDDAESRARGFMAGTDDYISKPFARAELLARVRRLLERTYGASLPQEAAARRNSVQTTGTPPTRLSA